MTLLHVLRNRHRKCGGYGIGGFGILEPMVLLALLVVVMGGTAATMAVALRASTQANGVDQRDRLLEENLTAIEQIGDRFTCCAGTCTTTPPTTFGTATSSCATNDPRDDRYYFPQRDDPGTTANLTGTTTPREPDAVDQLCSSASNTAFLTPLKTAVDALPVPAGLTRTSTIQPAKVLRITWTDTQLNRVGRTVSLVPAMAHWCP